MINDKQEYQVLLMNTDIEYNYMKSFKIDDKIY